MGLTQHDTGTDIVASLLNLMLACGMIGKWGAAMIPIRGQNNVQGASDVGAIPFAYTDYRPVTDPANRAEYAAAWGVPAESLSLERGHDGDRDGAGREPDPRACSSWARTRSSRIPNIAHAEHWVRGLEFLAVQDLFLTETARWADVVLPGSSFAEKSGHLRQHRPAHPAHRGGARPAGRGAARPRHPDRPEQPARSPDRRGGAPGDVMREIASVTPSWRGVSYEMLQRRRSIQYPVPTPDSDGTAVPLRGRVPHPRRPGQVRPGRVSCRPTSCRASEFPFVLNTGRQMYHWHTGTMTRRSEGLDSREPVPIVEMHPLDALDLGVGEGDQVRVTLAARQHPDRGAAVATGRRGARSSSRCTSARRRPTC